MVDSPDDGKRRKRSEEPEHRFAFGRRWETRKRSWSVRKAWLIFSLDLVLLIIVCLMAWMLIQRLG